MSDEIYSAVSRLFSTVKAGKVKVRMAGEGPFSIEASENTISVRMESQSLSADAFRRMESLFKERDLVRRLSEELSRSSLRVDIFLNDRKVFSMGKGISSALGNEHIYFLNLIRSMLK